MHPTSTGTTTKTRLICQTGKMRLLGIKSRLPRNDHRRKQDRNGPRETQRNQRLASTDHSQGAATVPRICELLSTIHPRIWKPHSSPEHSLEENGKIRMDTRKTKSLRHLEGTIYRRTGIIHARSIETIHPRNGRLETCLWSSVK